MSDLPGQGHFSIENSWAQDLLPDQPSWVHDLIMEEIDRRETALTTERERAARCRNSVVESCVEYPNVGDYIAQVEAERDRLRAALVHALMWMEEAWLQIDLEWGPCGKTLAEACADGDEPAIAEVRAALEDRSMLR
jgi:hypothetical protein